jgi:hypothetical protein
MYPLKRANNTTMQATHTATAKVQPYAAKIAREILNLETLETRRMDSLDFHELAVWEIREALEAAYNAGREAVAQ